MGGNDVISVGSVFAGQIHGVMCYAVVAIVPDRDGKDFVPSEVVWRKGGKCHLALPAAEWEIVTFLA